MNNSFEMPRPAKIWIGFCLVGFLLSCACPNPFTPGVCTSQGWGLPFVTHIQWCLCFQDKSEWRIVGFLANGALWLSIGGLGTFYQRFKRKTAADFPKPP